MIRARFRILRARPPVCRVGTRVRVECLRVGRFFARNQGIRLRIRHVRRLFLRVGARVRVGRTRVRVEGLCGCAEDGGGSGTRGSIVLGGGGRKGKGIAHDRLLVSIGRRSALLPLTDDGRGGVARAGPFSTLGKGDYRGMGFFILFFSILFSSGGVRIGERGRDVLRLGGCGVGVGSFVFHFRGFALGSDRSGGKIARGVLLVGEWGVPFRELGFALGGRDFIFARRRQLLGEWGIPFGEWGVEFRGLGFTLGGRDFIFARRRHLLGRFVFHFCGFGIPFGGCFLLGGGQGIVFRQAAHGTAVGFARRAHPTLPHRARRADARRRAIVRQHAAHRGEHRRGESARRAVDVEETEFLHHAPHRGGVLVEVEGQHVVVERRAAVATVAQMREQHDVDADARSAHSAAQTAAVADAEGARIEREIGGEEGHKGRNVFLNV